jgi:hypothetical protein
MCPPQETSADRWLRLQRVLFKHMGAAGCPDWPGADGLTLEDVVGCYGQVLTAGEVPDLDELLRCNPDLSEELYRFFARWEG